MRNAEKPEQGGSEARRRKSSCAKRKVFFAEGRAAERGGGFGA